jgi:hypothetical protein
MSIFFQSAFIILNKSTENLGADVAFSERQPGESVSSASSLALQKERMRKVQPAFECRAWYLMAQKCA